MGDRAGSSPVTRTKQKRHLTVSFLFDMTIQDLNLKEASAVKKTIRGMVFKRKGRDLQVEPCGLLAIRVKSCYPHHIMS